MERGQRVQIKIEDMTREGAGIGKSDGFAIFVNGTVTGDVALVELTKVKKNYGFGRLLEIVSESPNRVEPECRYARDCGGCSLAALDYTGQLAFKEGLVEGSLKRLGGIEKPLIQPIISADEVYRYRNKATLPISTGGIITRKGGLVENLGEATIGFYRSKSHDVVDCEDCLLQSEPAMAAVSAVRQFMKEDNITAYDPKWEKGLMRHLIVKTAMSTGEVMVILVVNGKGIPNSEKLVSMLDDAIFDVPVYEDGIEYNLASVVINVNKSKDMTGQIMGQECITIAGKPTITDTCGDLKFEISPLAFYQVNPGQMGKLYAKAMEYADLKANYTVLDLYCGVGTIGLFAANEMNKKATEDGEAGQVIGIESVKGAVVDANRNAVINGIVNARFICGRAEEVLPEIIKSAEEKVLPEQRKPAEKQVPLKSIKPSDEKVLSEQIKLAGQNVKPEHEELEENSDGAVNVGESFTIDSGVTSGKVGESFTIERADVVFLDPPRSGCDEKLLDAVAELSPERIVYVSCDPATLSRDVKYLRERGFDFVEATPVDMFPMTGHVETVVLMSRVQK